MKNRYAISSHRMDVPSSDMGKVTMISGTVRCQGGMSLLIHKSSHGILRMLS